MIHGRTAVSLGASISTPQFLGLYATVNPPAPTAMAEVMAPMPTVAGSNVRGPSKRQYREIIKQIYGAGRSKGSGIVGAREAFQLRQDRSESFRVLIVQCFLGAVSDTVRSRVEAICRMGGVE